MTVNPLSRGVAGREIVAHFEQDGKVAVDAKSVGSLNLPVNVHDYRITFEGGEVSRHRITYAASSVKIVKVEPLD